MNSSQLISIIFFILVILIIGFDIIKYGLSELLEYEVKIEFLVTISTIGACLLGNFAEGAVLMLLFFVAEYLEDFALDQSKKSMVDLVKLRPDIACVKKDGYEIEVKVEDLSIGDIVIVKPGDKVPIDGVIIKGSSSINQASITGESFPVDKSVGDEVYSSTINQEGYFEFKVTKISDETIFSKIIELIKESEDKKAKIDLFIDKFAKYYTPTIIILAILVAIIPYLIFGLSFKEWIYKSLVLLVISCPCALAISTPVSMVSAITAGTKNGIIIKGGEYIEELSKIKAISFDKTGTLTEGNLVIEDIKTFNGVCVEDLMKIVCSIENNSNHPIAKLFKDYSIENNILISELDEFNSINGLGLEGSIGGVNYLVGKKELIGVDVIDSYLDSHLSNTHVFIVRENDLIGFISLSDKIRSNSKATISNLSKKSIKTFMLTGDNDDNAFKVANTIGIDNYYSNLMPKDKVQKVQELVKKYGNLVMVGDGVNDSPSLAQANVGIAMGLDGADIAIETADIILTNDDISKVGYLVDLSKKTMVVVKQNISVSLLVKSSLAILAVIGFLSLGEAIIFGDVGLTLIVVLNALRISKNY